MLTKLLAFVAGVAFGFFPPELIAILITPSPGSGAGSPPARSTSRGTARPEPRLRYPGHRGHRIYRNPRRPSG